MHDQGPHLFLQGAPGCLAEVVRCQNEPSKLRTPTSCIQAALARTQIAKSSWREGSASIYQPVAGLTVYAMPRHADVGQDKAAGIAAAARQLMLHL